MVAMPFCLLSGMGSLGKEVQNMKVDLEGFIKAQEGQIRAFNGVRTDLQELVKEKDKTVLEALDLVNRVDGSIAELERKINKIIQPKPARLPSVESPPESPTTGGSKEVKRNLRELWSYQLREFINEGLEVLTALEESMDCSEDFAGAIASASEVSNYLSNLEETLVKGFDKVQEDLAKGKED